jgi:hypothetical protein
MKKLRILATVTLAMTVSAAPLQAANVWFNGTAIKSIQPYGDSADGSFVLEFTSNAPTCTSSSTDKDHYVRVGYSAVTLPTAKNLLAVAMFAMSLGKTVNVYFDDSTSNCYIGALHVVN